MSKSFDLTIDGVIDALRSHVLPECTDEFVRGQLFSIMFSLNGLKLAADWKSGPLRAQVQLQDMAFAEVRRLANDVALPSIPLGPRSGLDTSDPVLLEQMRDDGDRLLGELLLWTSGKGVQTSAPALAKQIETLLRAAICDQLKIELMITPKSMLNQIATGEEQ